MTAPDDLREKVARAIHHVWMGRVPWETQNEYLRVWFREVADAALAVVDTGLAEKVAALEAKLAMPCGSCHPCNNWANQTWVNAGRSLPHLHEYEELRRNVRRYALAWESARRRARVGEHEQADR